MDPKGRFETMEIAYPDEIGLSKLRATLYHTDFSISIDSNDSL